VRKACIDLLGPSGFGGSIFFRFLATAIFILPAGEAERLCALHRSMRFPSR